MDRSNSNNSRGRAGFLAGCGCIIIAMAFVTNKSIMTFDTTCDCPEASMTASVLETAPVAAEAPRTPKLADGCYHVFLDVGANIGVHGRFLMEPEKYPDANKAHEIFTAQFGPSDGKHRDNRDICVFAFEPNPAHHGRITKTSEAYAAMGWRYTLIPKGVSDEASTLQFYHRGDENREEWGFNAIQSQVKGKDAEAVDIPVIRLASWIQEHIEDRLLPKKVYGTYKETAGGGAPRAIMKMDIEGMEFRVLPDLLYSGSLCRNLEFVFGEMHGNPKWYPMELPNGVTLEERTEGLAYIRSFTKAILVNPTCKTIYVEDDEEAYLHDGIPLPSPSSSKALRG